jgi:hypothetical protein
MIFRRKQAHSTAVADPQSPEEMFAEIGELTRANRERRDPEIERRILLLRHLAGAGLADPGAQPPPLPEADFDALPEADGPGLPVVRTDQLSPGLLRAGILRHGCLLIRGVIAPDDAAEMAAEVERSFQARDEFLAGNGAGGGGYYEEFEPEAQYDLSAERSWVTGGGGIWGADSPRLMFDVLEKLERAGLQRLISDYLGERPAISVNKCTLRKVDPDTGVGWHQDGAFLGDGVRAMNVWIALTRCGDVAPGMDIVPRRLEEIVETGTRGATFDWSVGPEVAEEAAGEAGVLRPIFEAGDVLLFDDMFLHTTATDPSMTKTRYAIESWFFGPSGFPREYVPLAF